MKNKWVMPLFLVCAAVIVITVINLSKKGVFGAELTSTQKAQQETRQQIQHLTNHLHYFRDGRTGICFAYTSAYTDGVPNSLTTVPCEKVENLLLESQLTK